MVLWNYCKSSNGKRIPKIRCLLSRQRIMAIQMAFGPGKKTSRVRPMPNEPRVIGSGRWISTSFIKPHDMRRICEYLADNPDTNCLTCNFFHFWGGFDYNVDGGLFMSQRFGEPWGAVRRVFKWGEGFRYGKHRPPTVFNGAGTDITLANKYNISKLPNFSPVYMYHYSNVFPDQVIAKGKYYASFIPDAQDQQEKFEGFMEPLDETRAIKVFDFFGRYHWITRFGSSHPAAIQELIRDLRNGKFHLSLRQTDDIERVLRSPTYNNKIKMLRRIEYLRSLYYHNIYPIFLRCRKALKPLVKFMAPSLIPLVSSSLKSRLSNLMDDK